MSRHLLSSIVIAFAILLGNGCQKWVVVKQATPNPFIGQTNFHVEPVGYEGLMVQDKSEAQFKADRDGDANANWDKDKQRVSNTFISEIKDEADDLQYADAPGGDVVIVRSKITNMHGGISMGLTSTAAHIDMTVQLIKGGDVIDEISIAANASQGEGVSVMGVATSGYSGSDRLNQASEKLGEIVASYLESRTSP